MTALSHLAPWRSGLIAAFVSVAATAAQAQTISSQSLTATGTYSLNGGSTITVTPVTTPTYVDVLSFPSSGNSSAGLHDYGNTAGVFGSRSSGSGVYNVDGSFNITETVTNNGPTAANAIFNFTIIPGDLSTSSSAGLIAGQSLYASILFDIMRDGSSIWASGASLTTTSAGSVFAPPTQAHNIYTMVSANDYTVDATNESVNLGLLAAGQSLVLSYTITTHADGNIACTASSSPIQPASVVGGGGGATCLNSEARSGDPLGFDLVNAVSPGFGVTLADATSTPEPATFALLLPGLAGLAAVVRRRQRKS